LADFLHEKIWRTFYIEVLPDFLAYYFPRFHVQKDILSYLNITNWPIYRQVEERFKNYSELERKRKGETYSNINKGLETKNTEKF